MDCGYKSSTSLNFLAAKKYTALLGYNYQSSDWYERSYKILNSNYKKTEIKKDIKNQKSLLKKLKDLFK